MHILAPVCFAQVLLRLPNAVTSNAVPTKPVSGRLFGAELFRDAAKYIAERLVREGKIPSSAGFERTLYPSIQVGCRQRARATCPFLAAHVQHHRRDAANTLRRTDIRMGFGIDLGKAYARHPVRGRLELRRHHLAWTTPFGPKIDDHGQLGLPDKPGKSFAAQCHRAARHQVSTASSTHRFIVHARLGYPIDSAALRAGQFHGSLQIDWCEALMRLVCPRRDQRVRWSRVGRTAATATVHGHFLYVGRLRPLSRPSGLAALLYTERRNALQQRLGAPSDTPRAAVREILRGVPQEPAGRSKWMRSTPDQPSRWTRCEPA